jgi:hypothetical protein
MIVVEVGVHPRELNWVQNNSIFLKLIAKQLNEAYSVTFMLKLTGMLKV